MKKILLLILICISLKSCISIEDKVKLVIEENLLEKLNDPDSYKFARLELRDSVYLSEYYQQQILWKKKEIKIYEPSIKLDKKYNIETEYTKKYIRKVDSLNTIIDRYQELSETYLKSDTILYYSYIIHYRSKNKMGGMVKGSSAYRIEKNNYTVNIFTGLK